MEIYNQHSACLNSNFHNIRKSYDSSRHAGKLKELKNSVGKCTGFVFLVDVIGGITGT